MDHKGSLSSKNFTALGLMFRSLIRLELSFVSCKQVSDFIHMDVWCAQHCWLKKGCPFPVEWCRPPPVSQSHSLVNDRDDVNALTECWKTGRTLFDSPSFSLDDLLRNRGL